MGNTYDSDNLMYVSKQYESEIKSKVDTIYDNDTVQTEIDVVNKQLDSILLEMNEKIDFVVNKITSPNGIDDYVNGVHSQIDAVEVDQDALVDSSIKTTTVHPSSMAFKSDKRDLAYKNYDFINKKLELDAFSGNVKVDGKGRIADTTKLHEFTFSTDSEEFLKVIEFSFTYKQQPNIISNTDKIPTVAVTRIISGRFFLIRHDPVNNPNDFIIKAIIQNADNSGKVIDKKIFDVKEYKESGENSISYIFDDGPQFEMYFKYNGNSENGLSIFIGKIVPYRYVIEDVGLIDDNNNKTIFSFNEKFAGCGPEKNYNIDELLYSSILNSYLMIDKTNKRIAYSQSSTLSDSKIQYDNGNGPVNLFEYDNSELKTFWIKDVGTYCFIRIHDSHHDTTYIAQNSFTNVVDLNRAIKDVTLLSSGEIVVLPETVNYTTAEYAWYYFDKTTNSISSKVFCDLSKVFVTDNVINSHFDYSSKIVEEDSKAIVFILSDSEDNYISYIVRSKDTDSGMYSNSTDTSALITFHDINDEINTIINTRLNNVQSQNPDKYCVKGILNAINTNSGIYLSAGYALDSDESEWCSLLINCSELISETDISYYFKNEHVLKMYEINSEEYERQHNLETEYDYTSKPMTLYSTPVCNFAYNDNLNVITETHIMTAIRINANSSGDEYNDDSSIVHLCTSINEDLLSDFIPTDADEPDKIAMIRTFYFNDVKSIVNTPNGPIIVTDNRMYLLNSDKALVSIFNEYSDTDDYNLIKFVPKINNNYKYGMVLGRVNGNYVTHTLNYENNIEPTNNQIKYKYHDLFGNKYTPYVDGFDYAGDYSYEQQSLPIIEYKAELYCTFVDHLSVIYNITETNVISYQHSSPYSSIKDDDNAKKYVLIPNKYGFISYDNILSIDSSSKNKISDINDIKKIKFEHKSTDSETYNDVINALHGVVADYRTKMVDAVGGSESSVEYKREYNSPDYKYNLNYYNMSSLFDGLTLAAYQDRVETKYGDYILADYIYLKDKIKTSVSESDKLTFFGQTTPNYTNSKSKDFEVVTADDSYETTFLSFGIKVYMTKAYKIEDGDTEATFKKPFTDSDRISELKVNGTNMECIRKYDGVVYCWASSISDLYIYSTTTNGLVKAEICNDTNILDFIKIGENYHIICKDENNNVYYKIYGNKSYSVKLYTTAGFETTSDKAKFYKFNSKIIAFVTCENRYHFILKYDETLSEFVISILNTEYAYRSNILFGEYNGDIFCLNDGHGRLVDTIGIYKPNINKIIDLELQPLLIKNYSIHANRIRSNLYIDEDRNIIVCGDFKCCITLDKNASKLCFNTMVGLNGRDKIISGPIVNEVVYNNEKYNDYTIEAIDALPSYYTLSKFYEGRLIDRSPIGGSIQGIKKVYSKQPVRYTLCDTSTEIANNDISNHYKLDGIHTMLSPLVVENTSASLHNTHTFNYLIKVTEITDGSYELIDKNLTPLPIYGFNYYVLELNGAYTRVADLIKFDSTTNYYIKQHKFEIVTSEEAYDPNVKYYVAEDIAVIQCIESDFNVDENSNLSYITDGSIQYLLMTTARLELDINDVVKINGDNTRFRISINDGWNKQDLVYTFGKDDDVIIPTSTNHENEILQHMTFNNDIIRVWKTKFGTFALINFNTNFMTEVNTSILYLVRCSDDYKYIYNIIDKSFNVGDRIELYETNNLLFLSYKSSTDAANPDQKTYRIVTTTMKLSEPVYSGYLSHITEFEDGIIYGKDNSTSQLKFVKYEYSLSNFTPEQPLIYDDTISELQSLKHYNSKGYLELYLYGIGSSKHQCYKLSQNKIEPTFTDIDFGYQIETQYGTYDSNWLGEYDHKLYIKQKGCVYECDPETNKCTLVHYHTGTTNNIELINTSNIENYIGDVYPDKKHLYCVVDNKDVYINEYNSNPFDYTPAGFNDDSSTLFIKPISNNDKFLPLFDKNNNIYFKDCVGNKDTLEPDYNNRYICYSSTGDIITNPDFDYMFMTSIGLFGLIGYKVYFNDIYGDDKNIFKEMNIDNSGRSDNGGRNYFESKNVIYFIAYNTVWYISKANINENTVNACTLGSTDNSSAINTIIASADAYPTYSNWCWLSNKNYLEKENPYPQSGINFFESNTDNQLYVIFGNTSKYMIFKTSLDSNDGNFTLVKNSTSSGIKNITATIYGIMICSGSNSVSCISYNTDNSITTYSVSEDDVVNGVVVDKIHGDIYAYGSAIWKFYSDSFHLIKDIQTAPDSSITLPFTEISHIEQYCTSTEYDSRYDSQDQTLWCILPKSSSIWHVYSSSISAYSDTDNANKKFLNYKLEDINTYDTHYYPSYLRSLQLYVDEKNYKRGFMISYSSLYKWYNNKSTSISNSIPYAGTIVLSDLTGTNNIETPYTAINEIDMYTGEPTTAFDGIKMLPYDNSQYFICRRNKLGTSVWNYAVTSFTSSIDTLHDVLYKYNFIGENTKKWNNSSNTSENFSLKEKFLFTCVGTIGSNNEFVEKYYDMNNIEITDTDTLLAIYKNIYTRNNYLKKYNIKYKANSELKNNLYPSNIELLNDMGIFDAEDFSIDLVIYPGFVKNQYDNVSVNELRPGDINSVNIDKHIPCLPYNIYY